ncbi:response regulator [Labilibacter marinus]|uniref:response regulator n=1 Tax=Labilibacter marinus TaxID=1477105 RepID=UPI00082B9093|nr:response regulator [Labilibacter marinus]
MNSPKILIVDDSVDNLKLMVSVYAEYLPSYKTYQCSNSENALEIALQIKPDLIITDWEMPKLMGLDLIKQIKEDEALKDIPVIIATGVMLTNEHLKIALEAGAIDYIRKPLDPIELVARSKSAVLLNDYYNQIVKQKDKELTENALSIVKSSQFLKSIGNTIDNIGIEIDAHPEKAKKDLLHLKNELEQQNSQESWNRFSLSFSKVHADFEKNLTKKYPKLTPGELKLCSFIKLGMTNKEIASVLNQTTDSVKVSRYRLRKKINLPSGDNLEVHLAKF